MLSLNAMSITHPLPYITFGSIQWAAVKCHFPKEYDGWTTPIKKVVGHWVQRYGLPEVSQWLFDVWNESNRDVFWKNTHVDYFELYHHIANAIKNIPKDLKGGGSATAKNA